MFLFFRLVARQNFFLAMFVYLSSSTQTTREPGVCENTGLSSTAIAVAFNILANSYFRLALKKFSILSQGMMSIWS